MDYLDHVRQLNRYDPAGFRRFEVAGQPVGHLRHRLAERLRSFPELFEVGEYEVALSPRLRHPCERTEALAAVLDELRGEGLVGRSRSEAYAVRRRIGDTPLMAIDRGAATAFGIINTGFHLNGVVGPAAGDGMWIARRSRHRRTFPGRLDNMVAGGQPLDLDLRQNLVKECAEEASIPEAMARQAQPAGMISYVMEVEAGLRRHALYIYDLDVPVDFTPRPGDDEVEEFMLLPVAAVDALVREPDSFKYNCALVVIDFLIRHGLIPPEHPDYHDLIVGLRAPLP